LVAKDKTVLKGKWCDMESVKTNSKKRGRPAKTIRKDVRACIRFSKIEYFIIRQKASRAGLKASAYLRDIAINGEVKLRISEEERQFIRQLIGMSNNLNQLTKNSYKEGMLKTMLQFEKYRNEFDVLLKKLNHA
jgi:predicted DNA binding CopG/RHH family protein